MRLLRFRPCALRTLGVRVFTALGTPEDIAAVVAGSLVDANLAGHDSHGVLQILPYVRRARAGEIKVAARPRVLRTHQATALLSGEWGFGQPAGIAAVDEAAARAHTYGVAAVALVRCSHLGRVGEYVERAAASGCAAMVWVGGLPPKAVPHGGSRPVLGTNPIAMGFPVQGEHPAVLDFATTAVASGKITDARAARKELPPGCIVDNRGRPTTDPAAYFNGGALLPFAEHKGYALSVLAELLAQALTGADRPEETAVADRQRPGALFCAVDAGAFRPAGEVQAAARRIVERLRAVPPVSGVDRVLTPGEPEAAARRARAVSGIELPEDAWQSIAAVAELVGVPPHDLPKPVSVKRVN